MMQQNTAYMQASWLSKLNSEFEKPYMKQLEQFLAKEYAQGIVIYPPFEQIFHSFCLTSFEDVNVVIMGQDPYHGPGQAHGLCFSVPKGIPVPPSLVNIFKELQDDFKIPISKHGCLTSWAKQGVLLLNATLTVRADTPKSHHGRGWETFTDRVVQLLCERKDPIVFVLWGKSALDKCTHIMGTGKTHHLVLTAPHPSPLSAYAGFFGCRHFSKINAFLKSVGKTSIDWQLREEG